MTGWPDAEPLWLTRGRWPLFAWIHTPARLTTARVVEGRRAPDVAGAPGGPTAPAAPGSGAVVLCPPLLDEYLSGQSLYRLVARLLAERGVLAVRFDYEGTGDSGGPSGGRGRVAAWQDGVDQAVAAARSRCDGPLALLGVRSGALVAAQAAVRRRDVDAIVQWDPWQSGRAFLRRQRALQSLRLREPPAMGNVEVPGFVLDAATVEAIEGLRLPGRLPVARALHVVRPVARSTARAPRVRADGSLADPVSEVLVSYEGEQEACFEVEPLSRQVPAVTASAVVDWIAGALAELQDGSCRPEAPKLEDRPRRSRRPSGEANQETVPASRPVIHHPVAPGGVAVMERAVRLGPHGMFGIETTARTGCSPAAVGARSALPAVGPLSGGEEGAPAPTVVFLSSGTDSHVGPTRLWVTLARRLAASGVRSVRVDLTGLGESAARAGHNEGVIRIPEAFDDVAEVVAALGHPGATVLAGLCSGAYQALESALELHPRGVVGINPMLRFTPPEVAAGSEMSPRRRLCQLRPTWVAGARRRLPEPIGRAMALARRLAGPMRPRIHRDARWIRELAAANVDVYCVCGEDEARQLASFGMTARADEHVTVEVVSGLDHGLGLAVQREDITERVFEAVRTMLVPSPAGSPRAMRLVGPERGREQHRTAGCTRTSTRTRAALHKGGA